jgi:hypothetical protein
LHVARRHVDGEDVACVNTHVLSVTIQTDGLFAHYVGWRLKRRHLL